MSKMAVSAVLLRQPSPVHDMGSALYHRGLPETDSLEAVRLRDDDKV